MPASRPRFIPSAVFLAAAVFVTPGFAADDPITQFEPTGTMTLDHSAFDAILEARVKSDADGYNRVDYRALAADHATLDAYLDAMQAVRPSDLSLGEAHAYWINLYNAKTLDVVLDHYPVESIRRINLGGALFKPGPWSQDILRVDGVDLTLDDVEQPRGARHLRRSDEPLRAQLRVRVVPPT